MYIPYFNVIYIPFSFCSFFFLLFAFKVIIGWRTAEKIKPHHIIPFDLSVILTLSHHGIQNVTLQPYEHVSAVQTGHRRLCVMAGPDGNDVWLPG